MHYHSYERGKISTIGAISVSAKQKHLALYLQFFDRNVNGVDIRNFLIDLVKQVQGDIILLWDNSPIHRRKLVKQYIEKHPRLHVEGFPGYAPELNPAEFSWAQADGELAHTSPEDLQQLQALLNKSEKRWSKSQKLLWSCIYASDTLET